jgi:signal peptidase
MTAAVQATRRTVRRAARRQAKGVWHYLGLGLSIGLLLLVVVLGVAAIAIPKATGSVPLTVLTGSMKPGLPPGTLIIVQPVDPGELRIGDVATYQIHSGEPDVITHRILSISATITGDRSFTFKGDNNRSADPEQIEPGQVQGKVWYSLPLLGHINSAVGTNRSWLVPVLATGLLGYAVYMTASGAYTATRQRRLARAVARPHGGE